MSSTYMPAAGIGNAASYMVSGRPYLTGGTVVSGTTSLDGAVIGFPLVTKAFTVENLGEEPIFVAFASFDIPTVADNSHIWWIGVSGSHTFNCKTRTAYISVGPDGTKDGMFQLFAELTNIREEYVLTGSGITE